MRNPFLWGADWAWGMPLIVLTVVIHVLGLGFVNRRAIGAARRIIRRQAPRAMLPLVVGGTTLFAACLLGIEAGIWAGAYRFLDAFPDFRSAMLYSLNAITSYGQSGLPGGKWQSKEMAAIRRLERQPGAVGRPTAAAPHGRLCGC